MNRRKFISSLFILAGGAAATYYGSEYLELIDNPDFSFLDKHKELIGDLAETIIPTTDTPGAKEAMVHEYIIHMIKYERDVKIQNNFINGIKDVKEYVISEYKLPFEKLNKEQKIAVVSYFQKEGKNFGGNLGKLKNKVFGKSFFLILKEYTCIGYCTSMLGVTKGLAYEAIPNKFMNTNYSPGQKSWATK
jgi:hypothetical protein